MRNDQSCGEQAMGSHQQQHQQRQQQQADKHWSNATPDSAVATQAPSPRGCIQIATADAMPLRFEAREPLHVRCDD